MGYGIRLSIVVAAFAPACGSGSPMPAPVAADSGSETPSGDVTSEAEASTAEAPGGAAADVVDVQVTGSAGAYTFAVTIRSPDTGCSQYADWWEVVDESGALHYRRILAHSHVDEQPFTRSGGPVDVGASDTVRVRAHLNPGGYGGTVMVGTAADGFTVAADQPPIPDAVESEPPRPSDCAF